VNIELGTIAKESFFRHRTMKYKLAGAALTVLAMLTSAPVFAQLALQTLPSGDYAFKKGSRSQYIVFRKTGSTIIGQAFSYQSDDGYCFTGRGVGAVITDAIIEQLDEPGRNSKPPTYARQQSVSLGEYRPIKVELVPASTKPSYERCLRVMAQFQRER
jgi:hypothetical protein